MTWGYTAMSKRKDNRADADDIILHIWLHEEYYKVLARYGGLNNAVDILLQAMADGRLPCSWEDLPPAPPTADTSHHLVTVRQGEYVQILLLHGTRSPRYSLRRLLYAAVDNNWLEELGVKQSQIVNPVESSYFNHIEMAAWHIIQLQQEEPDNPLYDEILDALRGKLREAKRWKHDTQHT